MPEADISQQIIDTLSRCRRVLITTHVRPDGDALGSSAAMALALRQKGIESRTLLLTHLPRKYAFIFRDFHIDHFDVEQGFPQDLGLDGYDALVVVDTGTWSQLPGLREHLASFAKPILIIDHHLTQEDWGTARLVDIRASAAAEVVTGLLRSWGVTIDLPIASSLYLGIVSDTGWFQFSNTSPATLRLAADLMELGVETDRMYQALYQNERAERVALQTRAQQSLQLLCDGRLAVMRISKHDFEETHANVPDTENLINVPLQIATVEVSILAVEPKEGGAIRISLRSKGQVDVAKFAEQFGGGGHARAAGLRISTSFEEAAATVVAAMLTELRSNGE